MLIMSKTSGHGLNDKIFKSLCTLPSKRQSWSKNYGIVRDLNKLTKYNPRAGAERCARVLIPLGD